MTTPEYGPFDIGDVVRLDGTFTDLDDVAVDPGTVTLYVKEPDGTVTTWVYLTDPELVRDSAGAFHADWPVTQSGRHHARWESTGVGAAAEEITFTVRPSKVV